MHSSCEYCAIPRCAIRWHNFPAGEVGLMLELFLRVGEVGLKPGDVGEMDEGP